MRVSVASTRIYVYSSCFACQPAAARYIHKTVIQPLTVYRPRRRAKHLYKYRPVFDRPGALQVMLELNLFGKVTNLRVIRRAA